ncbi:MAG: sodium:proton antiporter [Bacteroidota bacterium]
MYESFSIVFTLAALFSFINYRWLKLPSTIGQMILALGLAVIIIILEPLAPKVYQFFCDIVLSTDFRRVLLDIMLGFLLFAGALHVDVTGLRQERWSVLLFATISVLLATFIVGSGCYYLGVLFGLDIPYLHCLLFGALISPTDPIAVLALLKTANVSPSLQLKIEGESLFNDGIGVIVFSALLLLTGMESGGGEGGLVQEILLLFAEEVLLGLALGLLLGVLGLRLIKASHENHFLATMISLAIVFGGYTLALLLHTSGPLAMVVAGLYLGYHIKMGDIEEETRKTLVGFWHILDESLNGVLFVMIGLALHIVSMQPIYYGLIGLLIVLSLLARWLSVTIPYSLLRHAEGNWLKTTYVLTWGGLKGGISLALAFSLTEELSGNLLLPFTYGIVIFSILVQGLTIPSLIKKLYA